MPKPFKFTPHNCTRKDACPEIRCGHGEKHPLYTKDFGKDQQQGDVQQNLPG
ncbi:MAG: hypothetical protein LBD55_05740 [Treponema sp.]|jgi:hypothetical protein|nr:hypothetical protein [Treponema sp.]